MKNLSFAMIFIMYASLILAQGMEITPIIRVPHSLAEFTMTIKEDCAVKTLGIFRCESSLTPLPNEDNNSMYPNLAGDAVFLRYGNQCGTIRQVTDLRERAVALGNMPAFLTASMDSHSRSRAARVLLYQIGDHTVTRSISKI